MSDVLSRNGRVESGARLLSPDNAAAYLGLGSRWAIYRLISTGQLPAMKLAGKIRIDREDLDALIHALKISAAERSVPQTRAAASGVPSKLAPLAQRRPKAPVATPMTTATRDEEVEPEPAHAPAMR